MVGISSWFGLLLRKYIKVTTNGLLIWWNRKKTREKLIICIIFVISTLLDWPYSLPLHLFRLEVFCVMFEVFEWKMNLFSSRLSSRMSTESKLLNWFTILASQFLPIIAQDKLWRFRRVFSLLSQVAFSGLLRGIDSVTELSRLLCVANYFSVIIQRRSLNN